MSVREAAKKIFFSGADTKALNPPPLDFSGHIFSLELEGIVQVRMRKLFLTP